jgi:hypothetical protein
MQHGSRWRGGSKLFVYVPKLRFYQLNKVKLVNKRIVQMSGFLGNTENEDGVIGTTGADDKSGVFGRANSKGWGVFGFSEKGFAGVFGSGGETGVFGQTNNPNASGVYGRNDGTAPTGAWGVFGFSPNGFAGVFGSGGKNGIFGQTNSANDSGVYGLCNGNGNGVAGISDSGTGVYAKGGRLAGFFEGNVVVTGDIELRNADCAEDFDIAGLEKVEPGTVMVIDSEGALRQSDQAYDKRVAGVISGAASYKPALILDKQESSKNRMPIALMGKVYCKVDASHGAIEVGDLLTPSPTPGHAMKADDPFKAFGAVIGKALQEHKQGQGLIPILVCLQ